MPDLKSRVKDALAARGHLLDDDIVEELASHANAAFESARADGADAAEAGRHVDALIAQWASEAAGLRRRPRRPPIIDAPAAATRIGSGLVQDVRYGMRVLWRARGFTIVAVVTMALGIGATTTLFSMTYGVLLKPLPWPDAQQLVRVSESRSGHAPRVPGTITNGTFTAWHADPSTIEEIGGWLTVRVTAVIGDDEPMSLQTASVTPSLFRVLKALPLRGRLFLEDDAPSGGSAQSPGSIILSHGLWQERFGGRDDAIGRVMRLDDKSMRIVGVMPRDFMFPDRETRAWTAWAVPSVVGKENGRPFISMVIHRAIARLRPGATPPQASAEGTSRARSAPDPGLTAVAMFGGSGPPEIRAVPAIEMMTAEVRPALIVLLAAVVLLLATATANVASLQLARATTRRREMAIRAAIGAGRARLGRQLVVESVLIGSAGGLAGIALAAALHRVLPSILPPDFPRLESVELDIRVLLFAVTVSLVSSVACALLPVLHTSRVNLVESLADGGSAPIGAGLRSPTARARTVIMVGQLAISCVLLVGAALLGRSFVALMNADRGYDPRSLLTARIPLPSGFSLERRVQLLEAIVARLRSMPGITEAAFANGLPLLSAGGFRPLRMPSPADPSIQVEGSAIQRVVSPGYFQALGIRMVTGRRLSDADTMTSPMVVVVNRSFAARYLQTDAIGGVVANLGICRGNNDRWTVVGIVDDVRQGAPVDPTQPEIFMPHRQVGCANVLATPVVVIRTADDPSLHASALRSALREQDRSLALDSMMTMDDRVMTSLAKPRLYAVVLIGFGVIAVVIAGVGLFGVLSFTVAHRTREIGVRTALGARTADIVALVVRQAVVISACGAAIGLWLAYALARYVSGFLYGVTPHDGLTYASAPVVLLIVTVVACVVPARRAARVDPLHALRSQ